MKSIGMIEYKTVSSGLFVADKMVKTSNVEIIEAQVVCPGKYIALIEGDLSAVKSAIDIAENVYSEGLISTFVLGNPDQNIFPAIYGTANTDNIKALGIFETYDGASAIVAADSAVKTANVELIELRIAKGMCGKSYFMITGEVSSVDMAINHSIKTIEKTGMYLDSKIIPSVDKQIAMSILGKL